MSDSVIRKIENVLTSEYSTQNFVEFIRELLDNVQMVAPDHFKKEYTNFSSHIAGYSHVGNYHTPDGKTIIILAVKLISESYVQNARSTQRSYAKKLIEASGSDAALIAFYTEGDPKWRLSFVRLDYEMKFENGKLKAAENITPAKRYSYLVGEGEPCHTAIERFRRFITDNKFHPTLEEFEEAFSVEAVTNEFFALYCEKFHQLREHLEASEDFKIESKRHNFTAAQFAKKLMGQIVFLYFLQKKGWLGVNAWPKTMKEKEYKDAFFARGSKSREILPQIYHQKQDGLFYRSAKGIEQLSDEDQALIAPYVKGEPWGTGPHNFMRKLFEYSQKRNANFFNDYLEPLFYNALNVNRGEQGYDPILHCRIPFLSGGLFEPIDGYEWEHNDFGIPNEIFSNGDSRTGTGILDVFDRYNFTMSEDEPLEREVAIDPEMLGKVFENLLEVKDRKSKGAFYTPREIVHYMCQESLVNYLTETLKVSEGAVRDFILYGDFMKDEDTVKEKRLGNSEMYISEELYKIDSSGKVVVNRLMDMDQALADVRIADPAVGSGAFPLGMLNEIVRARQNISAYLAITLDRYESRMLYQVDRPPHRLKYETIKNCIYAADIEPSAVDIAQLRLWLALVIDDEINPDAQTPLDGHRNPLPLPNLECNILCGNSLIDEFEGTPLINESELLGNTVKYSQMQVNSSRFDSILEQMIEKQGELFTCDNTEKKHQLIEEIEALKDLIVRVQLKGCSADQMQRYEATTHMASKPYILWQLDFARVFREKGGFDIVIGNPPYVGEKGNKELFRPIAATSFGRKYYCGKMDLFYFFFHRALDIGNENAEIGFITTNYYPTAFGAKILRKDFYQRAKIRRIINFNEMKVFESAQGQHNMITLLTKVNKEICARNTFCHIKGVADTDMIHQILYVNGLEDEAVETKSISQEQLYDGEEFYIRPMGVNCNTDNPLDSILAKIADNPVHLEDIAYIKQGIVSGADKYTDAHQKKFGLDFPKNKGIFILQKSEIQELHLTEEEMKRFVFPVYKNSQITRYHIEYTDDLRVLYVTRETKKEEIPNILEHLKQFKPLLEHRLEAYNENYPWYSLHRQRDQKILSSTRKIVNSRRAKSNIFALENRGYFEQSDIMITVIKEEYLNTYPTEYILGLLNSKLYYVWLKNRGKVKGNMLEMYGKPLEEIPIKKPDKESKDEIVYLVKKIMKGDIDERNASERIDNILYRMFNLSDDEIGLIEQSYQIS